MKPGFDRGLPARQQVHEQYRGNDCLNELQHHPVVDLVGCVEHEPGESPKDIGESVSEGRNPDALRPDVEPRHGDDHEDVVNRGHDEWVEERMLRILVHQVVDR